MFVSKIEHEITATFHKIKQLQNVYSLTNLDALALHKDIKEIRKLTIAYSVFISMTIQPYLLPKLWILK